MKKVHLLLIVLVVVMTGNSAYGQSSSPFPPSPVITGVTWEPNSNLIRVAKGSDNWPVTWGDDDKIYTTYGDGWGFNNVGIGTKVRFGVSRFSGDPTNFSGEDLAELSHWDKDVPNIKGTGILMVDGVLYMWGRRESGKLRVSSDHGLTWQEPGITMEQTDGAFHALHFAQFGPNYQGARDNFVYIYGTSRFGSSALGKIYLFRTPKDSIDKRNSYEFYSGVDSVGNPQWDLDINQKAPILTDPGRGSDARVVYNPGIDRYLLTYTWYSGGRGDGTMAILDAPEPWGPWTTVFYTTKWDEGFTFEYNFPAKWISNDGKTLYCIFSGTEINDAFVLRKLTLTVDSGSSVDTTAPAPPLNLKMTN